MVPKKRRSLCHLNKGKHSLKHIHYFLKANCIDSTNPAEVVFENEIQKMKDAGLTPEEYLTLEPYERDHAVVVGSYRPVKKDKK